LRRPSEKEDTASIQNLGAIVAAVSKGGIHLSPLAGEQVRHRGRKAGEPALTPRQLEALSLAASHPEWPRTALAKDLAISNSTFRNLLHNSYLRLDVNTLSAAIFRARQIENLQTQLQRAETIIDVQKNFRSSWGRHRTRATDHNDSNC
jgi:DNA-binding CsgD family transcriptional regulator